MNYRTLPSGRPLSYTLDGLGRAVAMSCWAYNYFTDLSYHPNGAIDEVDYGYKQGQTAGYTLHLKQSLNNRQLPSNLRTWRTDSTTTDLINLTYSYDDRAKVTNITDSVTSGNNRSFTYDPLGQLKTASGPWGGQTNTYDSLGNIRSRVFTCTGSTVWSGPRTIDLQYDNKNRVYQSVDSQAAGTGVGGTDFTYNYSDQPVSVSGDVSGTYLYPPRGLPREALPRSQRDGNFKRVKSVVDGRTFYNIYDASGTLVHVADLNPLDDGAIEYTDYVRAAGMEIARVIGGQGYSYPHVDALGSPIAMTNSTGAVTSRTRYTPFGLTLDNPDRLKDQGGFTGHIKDSATGLTYMQQRYYDPVMGRFLSIDPVTFMDTGEPVFFNRFSYAGNDPINFSDPTGMARIGCVQVDDEAPTCTISGDTSENTTTLDFTRQVTSWDGFTDNYTSPTQSFDGDLVGFIFTADKDAIIEAINDSCNCDSGLQFGSSKYSNSNAPPPVAGGGPTTGPQRYAPPNGNGDRNFSRTAGSGSDRTATWQGKDGSIWQKNRGGNPHGGATWKRWKNRKAFDKGQRPQAIRDDGTMR